MQTLNLVFVSLLLASSVTAASCYNPDGSQALGDTPCGNGTNVACCGTGGVCLDSGLCMAVEQQPYTLYRASCTDQTWTSSACPNYCLQESSFNASGCSIVLLTYLNNQGNYCCNNIISSNNTPTCAGDQPSFTVPDARVIPGYDFMAEYTRVNSSNNSTPSTDNNNNHDAAIGAGVGVPLGIIALAAIAWALVERRKYQRLNNGYMATSTGGTASTSPTPLGDPFDPRKQFQNDPTPVSHHELSPTGSNSINRGAYQTHSQSLTSSQGNRDLMAGSKPLVELDAQRAHNGRGN